jgi:hypothetical protein
MDGLRQTDRHRQIHRQQGEQLSFLLFFKKGKWAKNTFEISGGLATDGRIVL